MYLYKIKNDSINISHEITRTQMWQELVNSDKQLANKRESTVKNRKQPSTLNSVEDIEIPLIGNKDTNANKPTIPTFVLSGGEGDDFNEEKIIV